MEALRASVARSKEARAGGGEAEEKPKKGKKKAG